MKATKELQNRRISYTPNEWLAAGTPFKLNWFSNPPHKNCGRVLDDDISEREIGDFQVSSCSFSGFIAWSPGWTFSCLSGPESR